MPGKHLFETGIVWGPLERRQPDLARRLIVSGLPEDPSPVKRDGRLLRPEVVSLFKMQRRTRPTFEFEIHPAQTVQDRRIPGILRERPHNQ